MKRLNKKGFTLVELLVVIVILGVIMSIAIPSITSSIERSKDKQKTQIIKLIESAGELYVDKHKNTVTPPITLNHLMKKGHYVDILVMMVKRLVGMILVVIINIV